MIRRADEGDAEAIAAIYAPIVASTPISFEVVPPTAAEMAGRLASLGDRYPWLVADEGGVRGYAYASPHGERAGYAWSVNVSVYVAAEARRGGVARALYEALFATLAEQGFVNAYAGITLPNAASVGLHERLGFTPVGVYRSVGYKLGAWHDVGWWARPLAALPELPSPTRPLR